MRAVGDDKHRNTLEELRRMKSSLAISRGSDASVASSVRSEDFGQSFQGTQQQSPRAMGTHSNQLTSMMQNQQNDAASTHSQGLKFAMRKKKGEDQNDNVSVSSTVHPDIERLKQQLKLVTNERDLVVEEKRFWLNKLQEDNAKMNAMLNEVLQNKEIATKYLVELEDDKNKSKAAKLFGFRDDLLRYVKEDCLFCPSKRDQLDSSRRNIAADIYDIIDIFVGRSMSNMVDVTNYIKNLIMDMEMAFVEDNDDGVEGILFQLKTIASASPNNMHGCKNIVSSLLKSSENPEAIQSTIDKAIAEKFLTQLDVTQHEARISDGSWSRILSGQETNVQLMQQALKNIMATNENLKMKIQHYKKRNTQLRNRLSSAPILAAGNGGSPNGGQGNANAGVGGSKGGNIYTSMINSINNQDLDNDATLPTDFENMLTLSRGNGEEPLEQGEDVVLDESDFASLYELWNVKFDSVNPILREVIWTIIMSHIQRLISGHPLAAKLPFIYVHAVVSEVSMNIRGMIARCLDDFIQNIENSEDSEATYVRMAKNGDVEALIKRILQSGTVHSDIVGSMTFMLTYLVNRYHEVLLPNIASPSPKMMPAMVPSSGGDDFNSSFQQQSQQYQNIGQNQLQQSQFFDQSNQFQQMQQMQQSSQFGQQQQYNQQQYNQQQQQQQFQPLNSQQFQSQSVNRPKRTTSEDEATLISTDLSGSYSRVPRYMQPKGAAARQRGNGNFNNNNNNNYNNSSNNNIMGNGYNNNNNNMNNNMY